MRKITTIFLIIVLIISLTSTIVGCAKNKSFEVTFEIGDYDMEIISSISVKKGHKVYKPIIEHLPKEGFEWVWYTDIEGNNLFNFDTKISNNITLYLGERGLLYNVTYENINEDWFDITSLPTEYRAGQVVVLPRPDTKDTPGYQPGNWYVESVRDIGNEINEEEYGDLTLTFIADAIPYEIGYTNIGRIDNSDENYAEYITNNNPVIYKVTDGRVTLNAPTISEDCPHPPKEFLHWLLVKQPADYVGEIVEELDVNIFINNGATPMLKAIWVVD